MTSWTTLLPWLIATLLAGWLLLIQIQKRRSVHAHARTSLNLLRINQAVESASDAIGIGDIHAEALYINRAHSALFGYTLDEINHHPEPAVLFADKAVARQIHQSIRAGRSWHGETGVKTKDGRVIPAFVRADIIRDEAGEPIGIFGVFSDISDRIEAERALAEERERSTRAQRLDSLGMLAGGVAHDFGNLLTLIIGNIAMIRLLTPDLPVKIIQRTDEIEAAAWRAQELSQNLLAFARGSAPLKKRLLLGPLIEASARGAVSHSPVTLYLHIAPDLAAVQADPVQLDQVISNLCINAVQAMPNGGRLHVTAKNLDPGENPAAHPLPPGPTVIVRVADMGPGIPDDVLPRIWEPFFTTKQKGTGLGLATVYAVVKKHGGHITAESSAGLGTTFTLSLPAAPAASGNYAADGMRLIG